jgi:hypothetical protein
MAARTRCRVVMAVLYGASHGEVRAHSGGAEERRLDRGPRSGSHRVLVRATSSVSGLPWAYHDGVDLGGPAMARIARDYGYTVAELRKLSDDLVMSALRVELFFDDEAGNWHYRVPALHINGGGTLTQPDSEKRCLTAFWQVRHRLCNSGSVAGTEIEPVAPSVPGCRECALKACHYSCDLALLWSPLTSDCPILTGEFPKATAGPGPMASRAATACRDPLVSRHH